MREFFRISLPGLWLSASVLLSAPAMAETGDHSSAVTHHDTTAAVPVPVGPELLWELDAYYSSAGIEIPLTQEPVPDGGNLSEAEVYGRLFRDSLRPRLLMLEASVYPLPIAGTWFKKHHPDTYSNFDIGEVSGNELNVLDGVTAGFQEPWALSVFTGSSMLFSRERESRSARNRGYMGYLISCGAKHIRNNVLIDDSWWELEWKLKGERHFAQEELSWSFRMGIKQHGNRDIRDVAYIGLRRSKLDYQAPLLKVLNNANLEMLTELDRGNFNFLRQEITVGYNFPLPKHRFALTLDVGFIYESDDKYTGALADPTADSFTIVFRPNIKF